MLPIRLTAPGLALRQPVQGIQHGVACRTQLPPAAFVALRTQLQALAQTVNTGSPNAHALPHAAVPAAARRRA